MKEPRWLIKSFLFGLHSQLISEFGGSTGIRDLDRLEAAIERPKQAYCYGTTDLFDLAASYASAIILGHPFIDGNKRVGFMAAVVFLEINGKECIAPEIDATLSTLALASGQMDETAYAKWLRESCK